MIWDQQDDFSKITRGACPEGYFVNIKRGVTDILRSQPNSPRRSRGLFGWDRGISVTPSLILAKLHKFLKSPYVVFYLQHDCAILLVYLKLHRYISNRTGSPQIAQVDLKSHWQPSNRTGRSQITLVTLNDTDNPKSYGQVQQNRINEVTGMGRPYPITIRP